MKVFFNETFEIVATTEQNCVTMDELQTAILLAKLCILNIPFTESELLPL